MAPQGYLNSLRDGKKVLEIDPVRGPAIGKLFELYATGNYSLKALEVKAREMGLTNRKTNKPFSRSYLEYLLKNPIYCGEIHWNGLIYQGVHAPLVSKQLFARVQRAFARHNKPPYEKKSFAYVGLLNCGYCGCAVTAEIKKGKYIYYHCSRVKGKCPDAYIREEELDSKLAELVMSLPITPEILSQVKDGLKASHEDERKYHSDFMSRFRSRLEELERKIERAYEDKLEGHISHEFWEKKNREWQEEHRNILEQMEQHQGANHDYVSTGARIIELLESAPVLYLQQSPHERARVLKVLLSNCSLKDGNLHPVYREPFNLLLEMTQSPDWLRR